MLALSRQKIDTPVRVVNTMILFEPESREQAIQLAKHFRDTSIPVQLQLKKAGRTLEAYQSMQARTTITNLLYWMRRAFL